LYVDPSALRSTYVHDDRSAKFCTARLGTRTLDVLHVATAVTLEMRLFVTYDVRQSDLAKAAGLRVIAP